MNHFVDVNKTQNVCLRPDATGNELGGSGCAFIFQLKQMTRDVSIDYGSAHPINRSNYSCVAMLLDNFANPEWISVPCSKPLVKSLFCQTSINFTKNETKEHELQKRSVCKEEDLVKNNTCLSFVWQSKQKLGPFSGNTIFNTTLDTITNFLFLFKAVPVHRPPMLLPYLKGSISAKRYHHVVQYVLESPSTEGFVVLVSSQKTAARKVNLFMCTGSVFVSALYMCDSTSTCSAARHTYQILCEGKSTTKLCPSLLTKSHTGHCTLFIGEDISATVKKEVTQPQFMWKRSSHGNCNQNGLLPCESNHSVCYKVSEVCIYTLGQNNQFLTCQYGDHLQSCKKYECNMKFKCPSFYCILWKQVCDGKWNCPSGADEKPNQICGRERTCSHMFSCRKAQICVHLGDVCNRIKDCPRGDDEQHCSLHLACPDRCHLCIEMCENKHNI